MGTGIQWTEETWNPVAGCSLVSPGCTHCYAMIQAARIVKMNPGSHYAGTVKPTLSRGLANKAVWTGKIAVAPDTIFEKPLRKRKPTTWFVNSMSDLFHEAVTDATIDRVFAIMAERPDHRFQILTKRHERMLDYMKAYTAAPVRCTPLPNVWLGVSVEDQKRATERIPVLAQTPAAVRFLSVEPMLGPVDLRRIPCPTSLPGAAIDWIICGGESGPGARLFNLAWARDLRDQCAIAGIAFFMKQMGSKPVGNSFPFEHSKGGDMEEWPQDLRVRQMPVAA